MNFVDPERYAELKATGKLPSPRGVALSIIKLLQHDDFRITDLLRLVQSDPAIAGRLLYFSNAAAFGQARPIVSLERAIVALGAFRVRDLVIGFSVMHDNRSGRCAAFNYESFWGHSLATGIACQELAHFAQIASEELFTIGLLAGIGELALATLFPDEYAELLNCVGDRHAALAPLELQRFGMDHHELLATLLNEWGLPEVLIQAAFHYENPDAAGLPDGSRAQTLTHSLSFASALAHLCMVDEEQRWGLLPGLLARAARLGIGGEALNALADRVVEYWRMWGSTLQVQTRSVPPFAEILAAGPPMRRMGSPADGANRRANMPRLLVQLIGVPAGELAPLVRQIEDFGHHPVLIEDTPEGVHQTFQHPSQIIIAELSMHALDIGDFCAHLRQTKAGRDSYILLLAAPGADQRILAAVDAGADDVLIRPLNPETLRVHLSTATRMQILKEEIHRQRLDVMRSTDEFACAQKRLLQDALTDTLTQLPNRRNGLDFLASEWVFAQANAAPLACLMLDIDHFKRINDDYGHAAGDAVLRQIADLLKSAARTEDLVFRYGGEEFAAVLSSAGALTAVHIAERMRSLIENSPFPWQDKRISVTLSVGVAVATGLESDSLDLIRAADVALYKAKADGRNRVVAAS
jgi:diguanylate cyclase (GGDEF)-like protein